MEPTADDPSAGAWSRVWDAWAHGTVSAESYVQELTQPCSVA